KFARVSRDHRVLDLGCGTGRASESLAKQANSVVLLDHSPQMIAKTQQNLYRHSNVSVIVSNAMDRLYGDVEQEKFDRIVVHCSLPSILENSWQGLQRFAETWRDYLKSEGELVLTLHNTFFADPAIDSLSSGWRDPLRAAVRAVMRER